MTRLKNDMTVRTAFDLLDELGSANDPIVYKGEEMDVNDLWCLISPVESASKVRISYASEQGWTRGGTLSGMVADRHKLCEANLRAQGKTRCPECRRPL